METVRPLVSFIIPVHNMAHELLRQCIESIVALSLRAADREIIVIDDGSDESPLLQLGPLADQLVYIRQRKLGVSAARNRGLRMATGTFIQFVDGDDLLLQAPYEHVLDLLRYQPVDMVMFDFTREPLTQLVYDDEPPLTGPQLMRLQNLHGSAWGYAFKASILGSLQFSTDIAYGEDEEFTALLLLRAECVCRTTARAYFYRNNPQSATAHQNVRSRLQRLNDSKTVLLRLQRTADTLPTAERVALHRRTAQMAMDYIYNVIVMTRSRHYLERRLKELRHVGLYPLPDRDYTTKYTWFRRMSSTSAGLSLMMSTLPLMKRER